MPDIHDQILKATDAKLLEWLTVGVETVDQHGRTVKRQVNAAEMRAILTRISQLGIGSAAGTGTSTDDLVKAASERLGLKFNGRQVPKLDEEGDDAATGT